MFLDWNFLIYKWENWNIWLTNSYKVVYDLLQDPTSIASTYFSKGQFISSYTFIINLIYLKVELVINSMC